jgi:hypothetical protein
VHVRLPMCSAMASSCWWLHLQLASRSGALHIASWMPLRCAAHEQVANMMLSALVLFVLCTSGLLTAQGSCTSLL